MHRKRHKHTQRKREDDEEEKVTSSLPQHVTNSSHPNIEEKENNTKAIQIKYKCSDPVNSGTDSEERRLYRHTRTGGGEQRVYNRGDETSPCLSSFSQTPSSRSEKNKLR